MSKTSKLTWLELKRGGICDDKGKHARTIGLGRDGIIHGMRTVLLHDENGHIDPVHSVSAGGLDYPGVGPEHAYLKALERARYDSVRDSEALEAFHMLSKTEGIIPALESAHALAGAVRLAESMTPEKVILVNLSGRGDKDMQTVMKGGEINMGNKKNY